MIRKSLIAALALLASCSPETPAAEGVTARFTRDRRPGGLVIKAATNGDYRVDMQMRGQIRRSGIVYRFYTERGDLYSVKAADADAAIAARKARHEEATRDIPSAKPLKSGQILRLPGGGAVRVTFRPQMRPRFELVEGADTVIAGQRGRTWSLRRLNGPPIQPVVAVVSTDAALAPIGALLRTAYAPRPEAKAAPDSFEARMAELFAKGTVLRLGDFYALERIERGSLTDEDFALPGTLIDKVPLPDMMLSPGIDPPLVVTGNASRNR